MIQTIDAFSLANTRLLERPEFVIVRVEFGF